MLHDKLNTSDAVERIKGKITVELIEAKTGKVVEKQEKDNFIALGGKQYLQYLQRKNFKDQVEVLGPADSDSDYLPINPFDAIVLTDSADPAAPNDEWSVPGSLVGYSTKATYSGSDDKRGSPNPSLSEAEDTYTKWVFDWPTQAANGTINSVCWTTGATKTYQYGGASETPINHSTEAITMQTAPFADQPIAYANSNLIFTGTGTTVTSYDDQLASIGSFSTITVNGLAWDSSNNKLWVISGNQIASYDQTGNVVDSPVSVTARTYAGLTFDGTNLWTTVSGQVHELSTLGADVSDFNGSFITTGSSIINDIAWSSQISKLLVLGRTRIGSETSIFIRYFTKTGATTGIDVIANPQYQGLRGDYRHGSNSNSSNLLYPTLDTIDKHTLLLATRNMYDSSYQNYPETPLLQKVRINGMGSRAILPSSITKTNQQSLRITYQMDYS